jgi:hypothetical protein
VEARDEVRAGSRRIADHAGLDQVDGRVGGGAGDRIAAVGIAVGAALPLRHQASLGDHRPDRQSRAQALRQRHDVRRHAPVLAREHAPAAADAGLHFVEDQQDAVLVAQRAQARQEAIGRHHVAALALDRFHQDRGDIRCRHAAFEQHADVVEHRRALVVAGEQGAIGIGVRHVRHAGHRRGEALLLRVLAGGERQRPHRASVESAEEADEARAPGDIARQLDRRLDRLGAGLAQEAHRRLAHGCDARQAFAEPDHLLVPVVAGDMQELFGGALHRPDDLRMRVAGAAHRDAGGEVEEAIAVDVPHFRPAAVRHHEGIVARIGR